MRPENFDVNQIIDTCQGTCTETIQSALDFYYPGMSEDDLTDDDWAEINDCIFHCPECNWWCEISQMSVNTNGLGEDICEDCDNESSLED